MGKNIFSLHAGSGYISNTWVRASAYSHNFDALFSLLAGQWPPRRPYDVNLIAETTEDPSAFNYFTVAGSLQKD